MSRPTASVIIPNWNGASLLPTCLDALRRQTATSFETILVDNASRDQSLSLVREHYPEVRVLALAHNLGFAGGVNAGIRVASSDIIVLLNNDTEAAPQWLEALLNALADDPGAGMVASRMMLFDRRNVFHSAGDLYGRDGIPRNRGVWEKDRGQYDQRQYVFGPCGGGAAYRRAMLADAGPFDERFVSYLEDVDMAWRGQLLGYCCLYEPKALLYHHLSATGGGTRASYYTGRNTIGVLAKDVPAPLLRRHWPAMLRAQLRVATDAVRAWRGQAARARLRGQIAGVSFALRLLPARKQVQSSRRVSIDYLESLLV
ncbi:MAG: glycosyltransferase family 2 protein [Anaerolineae bacterium]